MPTFFCLLLGANEVFVHVHKDNMAAQKLYEKLGFEVQATKIVRWHLDLVPVSFKTSCVHFFFSLADG